MALGERKNGTWQQRALTLPHLRRLQHPEQDRQRCQGGERGERGAGHQRKRRRRVDNGMAPHHWVPWYHGTAQ